MLTDLNLFFQKRGRCFTLNNFGNWRTIGIALLNICSSKEWKLFSITYNPLRSLIELKFKDILRSFVIFLCIHWLKRSLRCIVWQFFNCEWLEFLYWSTRFLITQVTSSIINNIRYFFFNIAWFSFNNYFSFLGRFSDGWNLISVDISLDDST
jgi:hypothetical protein